MPLPIFNPKIDLAEIFGFFTKWAFSLFGNINNKCRHFLGNVQYIAMFFFDFSSDKKEYVLIGQNSILTFQVTFFKLLDFIETDGRKNLKAWPLAF